MNVDLKRRWFGSLNFFFVGNPKWCPSNKYCGGAGLKVKN